MPKGRIFVPSTQPDGNWFPHRGLPPMPTLTREEHTDTGLMLSAPYNEFTARYPPLPPTAYKEKDARNFKLSNSFSAHDNRNSFQDHGVYLGDGRKDRSLGRRITAPTYRQHHTDKEYLQHDGRVVTNYDYNSIYGADFLGEETPHPPTKRRYPRHHPEGDLNRAEVETTTTRWLREDLLTQTPLHVLAISQDPLLPSNKWKYSYNGKATCYPHYSSKNAGANPIMAQWTKAVSHATPVAAQE